MEKVNVRFTVKSASGDVSFSNQNEIDNEEIATVLFNKLQSWEKRVKEAAVKHLLTKEVGQEQANKYKVEFSSEPNVK